MADIDMIHRKPTGFSDPLYYEKPAKVISFVGGREIYAVYVTPAGFFEAAPISEFIAAAAPATQGE